jgi:cytidine deaminase
MRVLPRQALPTNSAVELTHLARSVAQRALVPYSGTRRGAVVLLSDGLTIPGVRVETATFPLVIPASINAVTTAVALGRPDIVAIAISGANSESDARIGSDSAFLENHPLGPFSRVSDSVWTLSGAESLPVIRHQMTPFFESDLDLSGSTGVTAAHELSGRAFIPESRFPVGCLMILPDGRAVPGVNCEHPDWPFILCAERNAIGTISSFGLPQPTQILLNCPRDAKASPCGACRQVLVELAPEATVWMDRGNSQAERASVTSLLPGFFSGDAIRNFN